MATCSELETAGTEGSEICGVMSGVGTGTASLLDALKSPLGIFLVFLGVAAGALLLFKAINRKIAGSA